MKSTLGSILFVAVLLSVACRRDDSRPVPIDDPPPGPPGMIYVPGGEFTMGSDSPDAWPEERPAHRVHVKSFFLDETEVTNEQFARFVEATSYVTTAEKPWTVPETGQKFPAGSLVFTRPDAPTELTDPTKWWKWIDGACWKHPEGPNSDVKGRENHPVVHVSWHDAFAYAKWAGKRLPTEAEFERAARGGLDGKTYSWGNEEPGSGGVWRANIWQGRFPDRNTKEDGYEFTSPVKQYPANGYGLYDMAGNVWQWCSDWYLPDYYSTQIGNGVIDNPKGPSEPRHLKEGFERMRVQRGGSFLCHDSYCVRYRVSARHGNTPDTGTSNAGFRCAKSVGE